MQYQKINPMRFDLFLNYLDRSRFIVKKVTKTLLTSSALFISCQLLAVDSYTVTDLGKLGDNEIFVYDVNDSGSIVGYSYVGSLEKEGISIQNNVVEAMPVIDANVNSSKFLKVNNSNTAVGFSDEKITEQISPERGVYTDIGSGLLQKIPNFANNENENMRALSINESGVIVGWGGFNPTDDKNNDGNSIDLVLERPFIFDSNTSEFNRLDPLDYNGQVARTVLRDINDNGIAVGWNLNQNENVIRSFYVDVQQPSDLKEISASNEDRSHQPYAINNQGVIAGKRNIDDSTFYTAFTYDITTQNIIDIPTLVQGMIPQGLTTTSVAFDNNESNQVVGRAIHSVVPNIFHAFIFENGVTVDLNTKINCKVDPNAALEGEPDWVLYEARSINNNGVIIGNGLLKGERKAFMLTPNADGVMPVLCPKPPETEEESGSGSIPLWVVLFIPVLSFFRRQK